MRLKMAHTILLNPLHAAILLSHVQVAVAVVYIVGGPAGWTFAPTASYYTDWASENTFVPGDQLSFRYDPADHNVQQVNLSDYATCNSLHPIKQYQSGHDLITLEHPGTYCFICGFAGHCEGGGMLIKLVVTKSGSTTTPSPPPENHPRPPPPVPLKPPPNHPLPPHLQSPPHSPPHSPPPPYPRPPPPPAIPPNAGQVVHPLAPAPGVAGPPEPPLSWPPPPVVASPPPPLQSHSHPDLHPKPSRHPPATRNSHHQNRTYESPAAPPPMTTVPEAPAPAPPLKFVSAPAPPLKFVSAPAPWNLAPAPSPSDDFDMGKRGRHVCLEVLVTCLVIAGGFYLW